MGLAIPSLSLEGTIKDPIKKADYLLGCFYTSQYSQSNAWLGSIQSLPYLILKATGEGGVVPAMLANLTESSLKALLTPWFDVVTLTVTSESADNSDSIFNIVVNLSLVDDGVSIIVQKALEINNSRLKRVNDLLNNREPELF